MPGQDPAVRGPKGPSRLHVVLLPHRKHHPPHHPGEPTPADEAEKPHHQVEGGERVHVGGEDGPQGDEEEEGGDGGDHLHEPHDEVVHVHLDGPKGQGEDEEARKPKGGKEGQGLEEAEPCEADVGPGEVQGPRRKPAPKEPGKGTKHEPPPPPGPKGKGEDKGPPGVKPRDPPRRRPRAKETRAERMPMVKDTWAP